MFEVQVTWWLTSRNSLLIVINMMLIISPNFVIIILIKDMRNLIFKNIEHPFLFENNSHFSTSPRNLVGQFIIINYAT